MKLFVTGAAGYIGGTFCYESLLKGYQVVGCDNFSNSSKYTVKKLIEKFGKSFNFHQIDLAKEKDKIKRALTSDIDYVIHFASLKDVLESYLNEKLYWENNLHSTINLINVMKSKNLDKLIFSSSAAVYGESKVQPVKENFPTNPLSPYAKTKLANENLITDYSDLGEIKSFSLRYFNPLGCHKDAVIKESLNSQSKNVMQNLLISARESTEFKIYGSSYPTSDGTAIRDFIHINDVISGHFKAMKSLEHSTGNKIINLGTGQGTTVLQLVNAFNEINDLNLSYSFTNERSEDLAISYADVTLAQELLDWSSEHSLEDMCKDSWRSICV